MSDKKLLQGKHFCVLPWMHARVNQNGSVYPCCRMEDFYSYGSLSEKSFTEIWNDLPVRKMRTTLMQDLPFSSCQDCYNVESQGGVSLRKKANEDFADRLDFVNATGTDGSVVGSALEFLDIRFSNLCNFKCRTCNYENSTSWYQDARSFVTEQISADTIGLSDHPEKLWAFLNQQLPSLKRIYFAGGEPLLHDDHYKLLELLISQNRTDIALEYNTNLSTLDYKNWNALELWGHFPHLTVAASLDGVGEQGELIRKGMDWNKSVQNFLRIKKEAPRVKFILAPTISVLNCFHITSAISTFIDTGMLENPDFLRLNILLQPDYLNVQILNAEERTSLEQHYSEFLDGLPPTIPTSLKIKIETELTRILTYMNSMPFQNSTRVKFRNFTIKLDQLRKERTVLLFPELMNLILN